MHTSVYCVYNVMDFGAIPGVTDCSSCVQDAVITAHNNGGGVVYFPSGQWTLQSGIVVYEGVRIQGAINAVQDVQHFYGTVIHAYAGEGSTTGSPLFELHKSSSVSGISVFYPNQIIPQNWPTEYTYIEHPYTFYISGANCTLENITLYNSYLGVLCGNKSLGKCSLEHRLHNIYGTVLCMGIKVDYCIDVGRICNVHFIPAYWAYINVEDPIIQERNHVWVQYQLIKTLIAYSFAHTDWEFIQDTFVWCAKIGYHFCQSFDSQQQNPGSMNGHMSGTSCDRVQYGYKIDYIKNDGILICNAQINANAPRSIGQENYGVLIADTCDGCIRMTCCSIFGYQDHNILHNGTGYMSISNCLLENYESSTNYPQIEVNNGKVQITTCSFSTYMNRVNILLNDNTKSAIICSNNATSKSINQQDIDGLRYQNNIGIKAQIMCNEVYVSP